ncbi:MAG: sigma-70 family RNA polymerase sigma factor [Chloroflexota bacterium]
MQSKNGACRPTIERLAKHHKWRLASVDELMECVGYKSQKMQLHQVNCGRLGLTCYSRYLYDACCTSDNSRRERAYTELDNYIRGVSQSKWADLGEEVASLAIHIILEKLTNCHTPEAFLHFVNYKILDARKRIIYANDREAKIGDTLQAHLLHLHRLYGQCVEKQVEEQEGFHQLYRAVQKLPNERQRTVILLRYIDGLSDQEIAEWLQITPGNVRTLRSRGLEKLRHNDELRRYFLDG